MDYLKVLVEEIHSVVVATVDETGHPHTAVMDMMWEDGKTVYFLTADFKPLYKRLKEDGRVALTGMTQGAQGVFRCCKTSGGRAYRLYLLLWGR